MNTLLLWKVLPTPSRAICSGRAWATGAPRNEIVPAEGASSPERRLIRVDLPAPLGPMSAWISSACSSSETRSTATTPPKCRVSSCAASMGSATAACPPTQGLHGIDQASWQEHDDKDDEPSHGQQPVLGERR